MFVDQLITKTSKAILCLTLKNETAKVLEKFSSALSKKGRVYDIRYRKIALSHFLNWDLFHMTYVHFLELSTIPVKFPGTHYCRKLDRRYKIPTLYKWYVKYNSTWKLFGCCVKCCIRKMIVNVRAIIHWHWHRYQRCMQYIQWWE